MVTHNHFVEEELRKVLSDTVAELTKLEKAKEQLQNQIDQLQEERRSYELALQGYIKRTGKQVSLEPDWDKLKAEPSHKARLISLAKFNGGKITIKDSSAILYMKGFIKSKRQSNAYQIVSTLLKEMEDAKVFEKVGKGEYRLVGAQQTLLK